VAGSVLFRQPDYEAVIDAMQAEWRSEFEEHRGHRTSGRLKVAKWTQEQAVAFECAREGLTDMMGTYSAKIAEEEGKPDPDRAALTGLENELARLAFERSELTITNDERLATVRRQYGALIRRFWTLIRANR
jgi:hypothetical protein